MIKIIFLILLYKLHLISKNKFIIWLKESIQNSGALYVKITQNATLLHDIFDREILEEMKTLQDNVNIEHIKLNLPNIKYNPYPIAAGSIAQVYKGSLDNKFVAIKVVRPTVIKQMKSLKRIKFVILTIMKVYKHSNFILSRIINIIDNLFEQIDLSKEVENMKMFRDKLGNTVIIPNVYTSLSNNRTIVMEHVDCLESIYRMKDLEEKNVFVNSLISLSSKMIFDIGILHSDMHPGNIYWNTESKQIVLFDFGTVYELNEFTKKKLTEMNMNFILGRIGNVAKNHFQITLNNYDEIKDSDKFLNCVNIIQKSLESDKPTALIKEMNNTDKSFCKVNIQTGNYEMFVNQVSQLIKLLNPEINFYKEMFSISVNKTMYTLGRTEKPKNVESISIRI